MLAYFGTLRARIAHVAVLPLQLLLPLAVLMDFTMTTMVYTASVSKCVATGGWVEQLLLPLAV